ncbi:MAG TPA: carbamoyltransferase HypF [Solirubrobacteraceae bacterium]|nr:carbamoyltransferase HypF [Solirubrobacteraceae bacterium]
MGVRAPSGATAVRMRLRVRGTVQGVGFRPHVYRVAHALGLAGFVLNDASGVLIEVEGPPAAVREFEGRLTLEAPALAVLDRVDAEAVEPAGDREFEIAPSVGDGRTDAAVAPDAATCRACLAELFDPADRRHRYPFINCTDCGPRFTIVRGVPYDRPLTTMAAFRMCPQCQAEYEDPSDRRFHAQPNACPACGPQLSLVEPAGEVAGRGSRVVGRRHQALTGAVDALRAGAIVAVKGLGGFHLACLASDERAVADLRARKHREDKPFALMAADLPGARSLVELTVLEETFLLGAQRPIVVACRRPGAPVARAVAPGSADIGVMLPYSPIHHLLVSDVGETLVMTSGNVSDEPIAYRDQEALDRLGRLADLFLLHDRPIETRTDDSVLRAVSRRGTPLLIRRSRGYVPAAIELPVPARRPVLACGAELKSTFCLARDDRAWVSHHIGDLENYETLRSFGDGIEHFRRLFDIDPVIVAHDLHPEYLSTKYALEHPELELVGVQHHHAHLAACLAEHGTRGPAVGAIYDGTGYGSDGTVWGGELLVGGLEDFDRAGHLWPVRLPGGAQAVREPWRMACAWLVAAGGEAVSPPPAIGAVIDERAWQKVAQLIRTGLASPVTTSMGRLFDAVAAMCGLRLWVAYEGQAAAELEAVCDPAERAAYALPLVRDGGGRIVLDARETVRAVARDCAAGVAVARIGARFHNAVASATTAACIILAGEREIESVALSGGSFQNRLLLERVAADLRHAGLRVLVPERLPPNDGGISYGQAAVAAARLG